MVVATLNRPEKLNALDGPMRDGLRGLARELSGDREARALLITGAGRGFCSGADMSNRDAALAAEAEPGLQSTELRYGFAAELQALETTGDRGDQRGGGGRGLRHRAGLRHSPDVGRGAAASQPSFGAAWRRTGRRRGH